MMVVQVMMVVTLKVAYTTIQTMAHQAVIQHGLTLVLIVLH
jgi:hypothetical protein